MARAHETVILVNPETYTPFIVRAGDEIPDWAVDLVTNPDILGGVETETIESFDGPVEDVSAVDSTEGIDPSEDFTDEAVPDDSWRKADIAAYLADRDIRVSGGETKDELLSLVNEGA